MREVFPILINSYIPLAREGGRRRREKGIGSLSIKVEWVEVFNTLLLLTRIHEIGFLLRAGADPDLEAGSDSSEDQGHDSGRGSRGMSTKHPGSGGPPENRETDVEESIREVVDLLTDTFTLSGEDLDQAALSGGAEGGVVGGRNISVG